jgi:RNA polymerase sigma-70 factor
VRGGLPESSWQRLVGDDPCVLASITALVDDAAGHWSDLELSADRFVAHLVERMPAAVGSAAAIEALHGRDLYLACACAHGDSFAIEAFVARFSADIERWSARAGLSVSERSDALQDLHIDLFWPEPPRTPQIATYSGRAPLRAWLRAVTMHAAIKVRRGRPPSVPSGDRAAPPASQAEAFSLAWATTGSPELVAMKSAAEASFEQAFSFAMGQLTPAERTLLRQRYLDGLTIDDLAPLYGVHRATMARRLAQARAAVIGRTRVMLGERFGLAASAIDGVLRLAGSRFDLSVSRHFREGAET